MACKPLFALAALLAGMALAGPALAQDGAETAVILSGTGQGTGSASRSMGSAVGNAIGRASDAIAATNAAARGGGGSGGAGGVGFVVTGGDADALEGTDAPRIQTGSGATIRTSGRLRAPPAPSAPAARASGAADGVKPEN